MNAFATGELRAWLIESADKRFYGIFPPLRKHIDPQDSGQLGFCSKAIAEVLGWL